MLVVLLPLLSLFSLEAQGPPFYNYRMEHGLPSADVYEMLSADDGAIWMGTEAGLVRFNGTRFDHFKPPNGEEVSVTQLYQNPGGPVYCRSFDGRLFRNGNGYLEQLPAPPGLIEYRLTGDSLMYMTNGALFVADRNGMHIRECYRTPSGDGLYHILNDSLLVAHGGLVNYHNNAWIPLHTNPWHVVRLQGEYMLFSPASNTIHSLRHGKPESFIHPDSITAELCAATTIREANGNIFINTFCGSYLLNRRRHLFPDYVITDVITDREGNYWFSSLGDGLFLVPFLEVTEFRRHFSSLENRPDKIIEGPDKDIFILGVGSLYRIRRGQGGIELLHRLPLKKECQAACYDPGSGQLLFESGGFYTWDLRHPEYPPKLAGAVNLKCIVPIGAGYLVRGWDFFGIMVTHKEHDALSHHWISKYLPRPDLIAGDYTVYKLHIPGYENTRARECTYLPETETFVLSRSGQLAEFSNGQLHRVKYHGNDLHITALMPYGRHYLAAARNIGLLLIAPGQEPALLLASELYGNRNILRITGEGQRIWLMLPDRLLALDTLKKSIITLDSRSGIADYEYRDVLPVNGQTWIASSNSLLCLPSSLVAESQTPPLLTGIRLQSGGLSVDTMKAGNFRYKDNDLLVSFEGIHFRSRGRFIYKSFLKGYDKEEHIIPANTPYVHYQLLPPGRYELFIHAENQNGYRSQTWQYKFIIRAPFWQQVWFYIMLVLAVVLLSYLVGFIYLRNMRKRNRMEREVLESKLTSLRAQMNPHFIFNALGSIQYLVLKSEVKKANTYLGKFSKLMRMVLEASDRPAIPLAQEIQILELYLELEKLRMGELFHFHLILEPGIHAETIQLPPLLLQPYVENAVRHGLLHKEGEKQIRIKFTMNADNRELTCTITDNGIGREAAARLREKTHRSFSSKANQVRLTLYHQRYPGYFSISYTDHKEEQSRGTEVLIRLPLDFTG